MGVVADLGGRLLLGSTILSVGGEILELGSPFLGILGPSSDFSGATESVTCGAILVGLASL